MLHVHVFLVALLGARHMAKPGADQHEGGVPIRERPHYAGAAADLTVQPLDHVVGADACPVFAGKIAVGQCLFNAVYIDVQISAALQGTVAPVLDVDIGFLVQFADGGGRDLAAPQCLRDVLHAAHGNARQIHLDEGYLHAAADQFLDLTLDNFIVQMYNFLRHRSLSPFECLCGNFILPEPASYVFFYAFSNLRKLLYIIRRLS